jgi:hypothetical protein
MKSYTMAFPLLATHTHTHTHTHTYTQTQTHTHKNISDIQLTEFFQCVYSIWRHYRILLTISCWDFRYQYSPFYLDLEIQSQSFNMDTWYPYVNCLSPSQDCQFLDGEIIPCFLNYPSTLKTFTEYLRTNVLKVL